MRRPTDAAPLMHKDEVLDTATIARLLAHDLMELRVILDRLSEHLLELQPEHYRWTEGDTES